MIINHNMQAMNAHRQMGTNATNAQKSMEKLSSGLKINRAGDDAAGLAISEKMRGQIRGLDQAGRNAQDGISMIQTAEGALNETHSILQRMRELSVQSANDTNTDADRMEIQKEIEQLTEEIDRIGNTTEFNTKNLLKGNGYKSDIGGVLTEGKEPVDAIVAKGAEWSLTATNLADVVTNLETDGNKAAFEFMGVTVNLVRTDAAGSAVEISGAGKNSVNVVFGTATDPNAAAVGKAIVDALNQAKGITDSPLKDFTISAAADGAITIKGSESTGDDNNAKTITLTGFGSVSATKVAGVDGIAGVDKSFELTLDKVPTEGSVITVGDKTIAFYDSSKETYKDKAEAQDKLDATEIIDIKGKTAEQIAAEIGKLDLKEADNTGATVSVVGNKITFTAQQAGTAGKEFKVETSNAYAGKKSELSVTLVGADLTNLDTDNVAMKVQVGDRAFEVDVKKLKDDLADLDTFGDTDQTTLIDALKNAKAADGTKLSDLVDISADNTAKLTLKAKEVGAANIEINVTGTTTGGVDADDLRTALGLSATGSDKGTTGKDAFIVEGKDFEVSFQVGANEGQNMSVTIEDMRAEALGISKIDVSKKEGAQSAVTTIDSAIEKVSAQRSNLGAVQNRLEHTINNLGTSSENLTAAESRIRDVDMAKEMMTMSKNNILNQAAQAMLAQANQNPQQVLQLLR